MVINTILASVLATPSKQFSNPLNVTRFNPEKAAACWVVSSRLTKAASISSNNIILCTGATAKRWFNLSSVKPRSERLRTHIPNSNSPARAVINDDFPHPGGPCKRYPTKIIYEQNYHNF